MAYMEEKKPEVTEADKTIAAELAKIIAPVPVVGQQRIRDCTWGLAKGIETGIAIGLKMAQGQTEQPA